MEQRKLELLLEYQKRIEQKAKEDSSDLISNSTAEHAKILIATIFYKASKNIKILTGYLNPLVYDDRRVIDSIIWFLRKPNTKVEIVVQENHSSLNSNELVNSTKDKSNCTIKEANEQDKNEEYHFIVADGKSFRYEPNKEKSVGIGCFNNTKFASLLTTKFQEIFKRAKKIQV